jgi:CRISPR-associated endonuclease/helicase Cas3
MLSAHRVKIFAKVKERLKAGLPITLISTQCVEAGVDIDFPVLFRQLAPLPAVIQANGRCNRSGNYTMGQCYLFDIDTELAKYPPSYLHGAEYVQHKLMKNPQVDLFSREFFNDYYRDMYARTNPEEKKPDLTEAINDKHFINVNEHYKIINAGINLFVENYNAESLEIAANLSKSNLCVSKKQLGQMAKYCININIPNHEEPLIKRLRLRTRKGSTEMHNWALYIGRYDEYLGVTYESFMDERLIGV